MKKILNKTFLPIGINILGLIAFGLMIASINSPWWYIDFDINIPSYIFPYMIKGPASEMIGYRTSPEMNLLTRFLSISAALMLIGSLLKGKVAPRILIGLSSVFFLLATKMFYARLTDIASRYDTTVQGSGHFEFAGFYRILVWTHLEPGFYIAIAAGGVGIIACILHQWIRIPRAKAQNQKAAV